jgi:hypothetical protein
MVNVSVTEASPSVAVMTTLLAPTLASSGVPARTPVDAVKVSQDGTVVPVRVTPSPVSASEVVTVYVYAVSSVAAVTAVLAIVGASLIPVIVMVMVWAVPSELVTEKVSLIVAAAASA